MPTPVAAAVKAQDLSKLTRALAKHRGAIPAQAVVNAAGLAWLPGLKLLRKHGADLNASFKNYRAIHALVQEDPHKGGASTASRLKCLEWLLGHGADPELMGAWPAARALVIAAFVGDHGYVGAIRAAGARLDIFTAAALGDAKAVARFLAKDSALATARDGGLLTALQCCGGSKLGRTDAKAAPGLLDCARQLVDAGADVNAVTKSWGHDVTVSYFVIKAGQVDMLEFLLDHGADATVAVVAAAWDHREDILDRLLAHGANLTRAFDHKRPVLSELVRWGQFKQARMLLKKGASPNVPDDKGWTTMHQAASRGNVKMWEDLLAAGGDVQIKDHEGVTAAQLARFKNKIKYASK